MQLIYNYYMQHNLRRMLTQCYYTYIAYQNEYGAMLTKIVIYQHNHAASSNNLCCMHEKEVSTP